MNTHNDIEEVDDSKGNWFIVFLGALFYSYQFILRVSPSMMTDELIHAFNIDATYLIGADGARSMVRKQLGYSLLGEYGEERHFFGGRMYAVYLRCPEFYEVVGKQPAWMNWTQFRHVPSRGDIIIFPNKYGFFICW